MKTITPTSNPVSTTQLPTAQKQFQGNADSQPAQSQSQTQDQQQQQQQGNDPGGHVSHDRIAEEAYRLYCENGSEDGHCLENWLEAERRLRHSGTTAIA
ncbi:MAG: DUF2934 domain-containing protein [Verrucomicrobiaceae bacterium]|nr:MAG: DUF2934 domain-containing protein [Verrucomicrobiaceae bacterium]